MTINSISADLLVSWSAAQRAVNNARTASSNATSASNGASGTVSAPWAASQSQVSASALVKAALAGGNLFDLNAQVAASGGSDDYKKLFTLYSGLNSLAALAGGLSDQKISSYQRAQLQQAFNSGESQLNAFLAAQKFDGLSLVRGQSMTLADGAATVRTASLTYTTAAMFGADPDAASGTLQGDVVFNIHFERDSGGPLDVSVDLSGMGGSVRSLNNVVAYINQQLGAAGVQTRFAATKAAAVAGSQSQWALSVNTVSGENASFTAAGAAPAFYLTGAVGAANAATSFNVLKMQEPIPGASLPSGTGAAGLDFNQIIAKASDIDAVRATVAAPDGGFYVLADVSKSIDGQMLKGGQDVALIKFDSAGTRLFTRTLGASESARGLSVAVGADGAVAIAGSIQGAWIGQDSSTDKSWDSFVSVIDANGAEQWTYRSQASGDDSVASIAIADNGQVYVAGASAKALPGQIGAGEQDSYIRGFNADGSVRFTQQFGTAGADAAGAIAVQTVSGDVQIVVAGDEQGRAVLRSFTDSGGAAVAGATRDLGSLAGGAISQLQFSGGALYVGGETKSGDLSAGVVAQAYSGGQDGFVAKLSADLIAGGSDRISYVGAAGDDNLAGFSVIGGQVYVAGDTAGGLGGASLYGDRDAFVGRLDAAGALAWSQHIPAAGGTFTAGAMAVDPTGASALDRLGLPYGALGLSNSSLLTSRTALRAGDSFSLSINGGAKQKITVLAADTLATLAARIKTALLSHGSASAHVSGNLQNLQISAVKGYQIQLFAGPEGQDALAGLGIPEGIVQSDATTAKTASTTTPSGATKTKKVIPTFGLGLPSNFDVSAAGGVAEAVKALGDAMAAIQSAYRTLSTPVSADPTKAAPAYLTAQIANYQAGLARLQASQENSDSATLTSLAVASSLF